MPLAKFPNNPYTVTSAPITLATVGAISSTDPRVPLWNPFARNDTEYRNIVFVGHAADAELKFLANNPHFNPYAYATVAAVLDCQRLYEMLHPGSNAQSIEFLINYCFPEHNVALMKLHNAGNDAFCELEVCMMLLKKLAERYGFAEGRPAFPKIWDAIFVAVDVEALNGDKYALTELGFACLDSRRITNIHDASYEQHITASHFILRDVVPPKNSRGRRWWEVPRYGNTNRTTDSFYRNLGKSKEVFLNETPPYIKPLFFVPGSGKWNWLAPAGLKPEEEGECVIEQSSAYWDVIVRCP